MNLQIQFIFCIALALTAVQVVSAKFLAEKPNFVHSCKLLDPSLNRCFADNLQTILHEWKNGIPGLKSFGSLDPLYVKRVTFAREGNGGPTVNGELTNIMLTGLSNAIVKELSFDSVKRTIQMEMIAPKITLDPEFHIKGRLLTLPFDRQGKATSIIDNVMMLLNIHYKLRTEKGFTFIDIEKLHLDIKDISNFSLQLDRSNTNGQEALQHSANSLLNSNWRDIFQIARPTINGAIEAIMKDRLKKILSYIPATFLIEDLSTSTA